MVRVDVDKPKNCIECFAFKKSYELMGGWYCNITGEYLGFSYGDVLNNKDRKCLISEELTSKWIKKPYKDCGNCADNYLGACTYNVNSNNCEVADTKYHYYCKNCNTQAVDDNNLSKYCPECGAKMI